MYPFIRMGLTMAAARKMPPLPVDGTHQSRHRAMPWDLDVFGEVNNGRLLSLYDLGRFGLVVRVGLTPALRKNRWGFTIAGASIRYRHRLLVFEKYAIRSRAIGRDERFIYLSQSMWRGETALSHALYRTAVVDRNGIVPTDRVAEALNAPDWAPTLPAWAEAWVAAEAERPWPPEETPAV